MKGMSLIEFLIFASVHLSKLSTTAMVGVVNHRCSSIFQKKIIYSCFGCPQWKEIEGRWTDSTSLLKYASPRRGHFLALIVVYSETRMHYV